MRLLIGVEAPTNDGYHAAPGWQAVLLGRHFGKISTKTLHAGGGSYFNHPMPPRKSPQKRKFPVLSWFERQGAGVKAAVIGAAGAVVAAVVTMSSNLFDIPDMKQEIGDLTTKIGDQRKEIAAKDATITQLNILLTPLRTVGLEKFAGPQEDAVRKMSDYVIDLQKRDIERSTSIMQLQDEILRLKKSQGPRILNKEQVSLLKDELNKGPKGPIMLWAPFLDGEARMLEMQLSDIFKECGFEIIPGTLQMLGGGKPGGFLITNDPKKMPSHTLNIQKSLRKIGLLFPGNPEKMEDMDRIEKGVHIWDEHPDTVLIIINQKP